ncbi:MAG: hypothetical protein JXR03_05715 [Cyclobacteriaceae bacterium]
MKATNKLFLNEDEKSITALVEHAAAKEFITNNELVILSRQIDFLQVNGYQTKDGGALKPYLPEDNFKKFTTIYALEKELIEEGRISKSRVSILTRILLYLKVRKDRSLELIKYLKINILNGINPDVAYARLGYLLEPASQE